MSIAVSPVSGCIGAEIDGFDVRNPADDMPALLDALHHYGVVFIRGAHLTDAEQLALGHHFGQPSVSPAARLFGMGEPMATEIKDTATSPPRADYWHTDATWTPEPPAYALLQSMITCDRGGDTLWASGAAIYDALSPAMQDLLCRLTTYNDNESFIRGTLDKISEEVAAEFDIANRLQSDYPPIEHPLVRTHPITGRRAVFWGGRFLKHIVGLEKVESDAMMAMLAGMLDDPRFHVRWHWTEGDLAIWDEAQTMHRSAGDHAGQVRSVRRVEIDGDRPFFTP